MKKTKIAILSNFIVNPLQEIMEKKYSQKDISVSVYIPSYNQYIQEIVNDASGLYSFSPEIIFILLDAETLFGDFYYLPYEKGENQREKFFEETFNELKDLLILLKNKTKAKIVINNFLLPLCSSKGILENREEKGIKNTIQNFNEKLNALTTEDDQMFIFDLNIFCMKIGFEKLVDKRFAYLADMKISIPALEELSEEYLAYLIPLISMTKKCIVLDLDNTLWGGVIGEDGFGGIKLGLEKEGKPFFDFQKKLLALNKEGIILAINSKNNLKDAMNALKNHKYMILKEDNFACMRINWQDKATNMKEIANELNLGMDSFVFIDDSLTERMLIKELIPEVYVVDLPKDPSYYPDTLDNLKLFNRFNITKEDFERGQTYAIQKKREKLKSSVRDLDSFLKQLKISMSVGKANEIQVPRISQLTKKTNQFTLTTKRYSEEEITKFSNSKDYLVKFIQVEDKFGDYGITGVSIIKKLNSFSWEIDSFLLSCRILGKDIEFAFMQEIIKEADEEGITNIYGRFIATERNFPAKDFLKNCGFILDKKADKEEYYRLNTGKEKKRITHIKIKNESSSPKHEVSGHKK